MSETAELTMLAAAQAGDAAALEGLVARYQDQIYRFGLRMCGDPEDAKDVLQSTLLAMARGVRDFRGASSLSTWLYTIARSYCIKQRRRSKFAPTGSESLDDAEAAGAVADPSPGPPDALANKQLAQALEQAIATLESSYREVLVLRDVEGLTAPEVALVLGVTVDAVKSRLHRARSAVRAALAPLLDPPGPASISASCPDVVTLFSRRLEDEIGAELCADLERHLRACPRCQGACDALRRTLTLCRTVPTAAVPLEIQRSVRGAVRDLLAERGRR